MDELKVCICRSPQASKYGEISISEISGVMWDSISGGINRRQSGYSLYGYISYTQASKLVNCSGLHDYGHNDAKICITASSNKHPDYIQGYKELLKQAGSKPDSQISLERPANFPPCTKRILQLLDTSMLTRGELRKLLLKDGYKIVTIRNALIALKKQSKICLIGSPQSPKQEIKKMNTY